MPDPEKKVVTLKCELRPVEGDLDEFKAMLDSNGGELGFFKRMNLNLRSRDIEDAKETGAIRTYQFYLQEDGQAALSET